MEEFYIPTWTLSVHSPAQCQQLSYDRLGNRMCMHVNTPYSSGVLKRALQLLPDLLFFSSTMPPGLSSLGLVLQPGTQKEKTNGVETLPARSLHELERKIDLRGCKPLRFQSDLVQGEADSSSLLHSDKRGPGPHSWQHERKEYACRPL